MTFHTTDFPFLDIRNARGDYFATIAEAKAAGFDENQIWSVVGGDENCMTYGPSHHYINLLGYVCTVERHDGDTYYEESWPSDDDEYDDEDCQE